MKLMKAGSSTKFKEKSFVLLGWRQENIILARLIWKSEGSAHAVAFDGARVLKREETHGDLIGFFHTHPDGFTIPSKRDDDTLNSWSFCFGKPLVSVISTQATLRAWIYDASGAAPSCQEIESVAVFNKRHIVLVL